MDDLDLTVESGQHVAVIGPSGAGKSTIIRLLNATVAPTSGSVRVLDAELAGASARALRAVQRRIGTVHQQFHLVGELQVVHNVNAGRLAEWSLWRSLTSLLRPRDVPTARAALDRVGLADRTTQRTSTLSGGEQQRVAIARVLVQRPALVLADEPVASLDPARGAEIVALLHEVCRESGATLLSSLHDVELARRGFDRVIGVREGRVRFDTAPDRLTTTMTDALYELAPTPHRPEPGPGPGPPTGRRC
ncbi:ATP-binding cassette domain-containing protein [Pseudonocardia sp.]|uniref:phosphonate ABC transporter ATP-binding protein n=1 Tax=Pseudonocardia sp. TaxID=60912 RepID=UPI0026393CBF|nr:ATP-binding cassette domain-containing protein [Pseudonocardia sp.]